MKANQPEDDGELLPNFAEPDPPLNVLIECVDREIKYRRRVYPFRINKGTMKAPFAFRQIQLMEAVKRNLEEQQPIKRK
jgi:hypothetical protein